MADVVKKIKNSNNIKNGYATLGVDKSGNIESRSPNSTETPSLDAIETRYTNRLDDLGYYE